MKDIKSFILESSESWLKKLDEKECPLADSDWYEKNNLYSYATVPNVEGFADEFELDYVGEYWALSEQLNVEIDNLPLDMMPYSYSYSDESMEDYDYYENQWKKGTKAEQKKTIKMIWAAIEDNNNDEDYD